MRGLTFSLALSLSVPAMADEENKEDGKQNRGNTADLCCIVCGGWAVLLALTCPPCTFCAQPFFWLVSASGGECFKGSGNCSPSQTAADAWESCAAGVVGGGQEEPKEVPPPPPPDANPPPLDDGVVPAMSY